MALEYGSEERLFSLIHNIEPMENKGTTIWFWGGGGKILSGQIIYFHHGLGRIIYFQVYQGQNIYFQLLQLQHKFNKQKEGGHNVSQISICCNILFMIIVFGGGGGMIMLIVEVIMVCSIILPS